MLALFPFLLLIGLFLPGYFVARCFRQPLWWAAAFVISLPVLFHSIFWLGVGGISINLWSVLSCMLAASAAAALLQRKFSIAAPTPDTQPPLRGVDRVLLISSGVVGLVLVIHSAIAPLMGGDVPFRWDFLAQKLLALGRFDFYPPLTPEHFKTYFFVDGIPPMVSFTNWWLYASAGQYMPSLVSIFVAAQFACTLAFTYGAATAIFSRRAGVIAAALVASSPLYFDSTALGQETGLTALAIAATVYFVVSARSSNDVPSILCAGVAAGLCALSREYGWIAMLAGAVALLWRRQPARLIAIFGGMTALVAAPWYVRNWVLAGNPFYSIRFGSFNVNPVHDQILHFYSSSLGVSHWSFAEWSNLLLLLLLIATFQLLLGIPGSFLRFRRDGYLAVIALLLVGVWLLSAGFTSGGVSASTRVLSPVIVVLSITAAGFVERFTALPRRYLVLASAILVCQLWTAAQGAVYPQQLTALPPAQWIEKAFPQVSPPAEFQARDQLVQLLPHGDRVLSDSAYLHAALAGTGVEVVPVWSPEVRFLFTAAPEEAERRLRELHIGSVVCYPQSLNMSELTATSPFYATLPERWRALAQIGDSLYVLVPKYAGQAASQPPTESTPAPPANPRR